MCAGMCGADEMSPPRTPECPGITDNNFAAALGLPMAVRKEESPQAIYSLWQLRRAQFLVLQENADKATTVRLWDEQHMFVSLLVFSSRLVKVLNFFFRFLSLVARRTKSWTLWFSLGRRGVTRWRSRTFLPLENSLLFLLLSHPRVLPVLQRRLLWMLPVEAWQEVLGFCPFKEYVRMTRRPASREFYFLLKQSLLELRFGSMLPSPALGGLWMASRDVMATRTRVLHLGFFVSAAALFAREFFSFCHLAFRCAGTASLSSCLAMEQLAEIVPLPFLRKLAVKLTRWGVSSGEVHQRVAPLVRAPQRLEVVNWEDGE